MKISISEKSFSSAHAMLCLEKIAKWVRRSRRSLLVILLEIQSNFCFASFDNFASGA